MDNIAGKVRCPVGAIFVLTATDRDAKHGFLMRAQHRVATPFHSPRDLIVLTLLRDILAQHDCGIVAVWSNQACKTLNMAWCEGDRCKRGREQLVGTGGAPGLF